MRYVDLRLRFFFTITIETSTSSFFYIYLFSIVVNKQLIQNLFSLEQELQNDIFIYHFSIPNSRHNKYYILITIIVRVFYKEKFEYKCTVRHVDAQKKFLAKIKTDSFSKSTSANALFCILLKRLVTSIKTHDRNGHTTFNCVLKKSFYLAISCR